MAKQGKRLTREQKAILQGHGLNWREYEFMYQVNESYIKVRNKATGIERVVDVYKKSKNKWDY